MSLVKSSVLTPAKLAANRANALKSTGPRSDRGKRRSSINAWRHGWRTQVTASCIPELGRPFDAYLPFQDALRAAVLPAENARGEQMLLYLAAVVCKVKRNYDRWLEARTPEDRLLLDAGVLPRPGGWRLRLKRTDWRVTISVWVRRSRAPGTAGMIDLPRQHTMVKVTCVGHPSFPEAGSRAVNIKGEGLWTQCQASGDCETAPEPSQAAADQKSLEFPSPITDERSQNVDESKTVAKISRRRPSYETAPHGIGSRRPRAVMGRKRKATPRRRPVEAASAATVRRFQALPQPLGATNEATMFQKTKGFKKYLENLATRFWISLAGLCLRPVEACPDREAVNCEIGEGSASSTQASKRLRHRFEPWFLAFSLERAGAVARRPYRSLPLKIDEGHSSSKNQHTTHEWNGRPALTRRAARRYDRV
ncbi:MAG TPA: hypothetical protein VI455_10255 [Terriglobia bacterium]